MAMGTPLIVTTGCIIAHHREHYGSAQGACTGDMKLPHSLMVRSLISRNLCCTIGFGAASIALCSMLFPLRVSPTCRNCKTNRVKHPRRVPLYTSSKASTGLQLGSSCSGLGVPLQLGAKSLGVPWNVVRPHLCVHQLASPSYTCTCQPQCVCDDSRYHCKLHRPQKWRVCKE
jgi:hypothetical protein